MVCRSAPLSAPERGRGRGPDAAGEGAQHEVGHSALSDRGLPSKPVVVTTRVMFQVTRRYVMQRLGGLWLALLAIAASACGALGRRPPSDEGSGRPVLFDN